MPPVVQPPAMQPGDDNGVTQADLSRLTGSAHASRNSPVIGWHIDPDNDLPDNGEYGLKITRPTTGNSALVNIDWDGSWREQFIRTAMSEYDATREVAEARIDALHTILWSVTQKAYQQYTRHLHYDPGTFRVTITSIPSEQGEFPIGAYVPSINRVVLDVDWLWGNYDAMLDDYLNQDTPIHLTRSYQEMLFVLTHEAGHHFGYHNHGGSSDGCGAGDECHAPYGSGSVMSYDHLQGGSVRYNVTSNDIQHIPNATWSGTSKRFTAEKTADPYSIASYGVWIDHEFRVSGRTAPGELSGGHLSIVDTITGTPWVHGRPSENVVLAGDAQYSGQDNFIGVDAGVLAGSLLRADANLTYTFSSNRLNLRLENFEAHYATAGVKAWNDDERTFSYDIQCSGSECSSGAVQTNWYADGDDPVGYVGGTVSDSENHYSGAFVAEKD